MKQKAIIVDIDGTLSDNTARLHFFENHSQVKDWTEINEMSINDPPHVWCQNLVHLYNSAGYKIIFITGRADNAKRVTTKWLDQYINKDVDYTLHMRGSHDHRDDYIVKQDIYNEMVKPYYEVDFAVDDRQSVVDMWRSIGVTCLQCKESDY
jgi:acid phosphatase class B